MPDYIDSAVERFRSQVWEPKFGTGGDLEEHVTSSLRRILEWQEKTPAEKRLYGEAYERIKDVIPNFIEFLGQAEQEVAFRHVEEKKVSGEDIIDIYNVFYEGEEVGTLEISKDHSLIKYVGRVPTAGSVERSPKDIDPVTKAISLIYNETCMSKKDNHRIDTWDIPFP